MERMGHVICIHPLQNGIFKMLFLPTILMAPPMIPIINAVMAALELNTSRSSTNKIPIDLKNPIMKKFTVIAPTIKINDGHSMPIIQWFILDYLTFTY